MNGLCLVVVTCLVTLEQTTITIPCHGSPNLKISAELFSFSCFANHLNVHHSHQSLIVCFTYDLLCCFFSSISYILTFSLTRSEISIRIHNGKRLVYRDLDENF